MMSLPSDPIQNNPHLVILCAPGKATRRSPDLTVNKIRVPQIDSNDSGLAF
jgi:hypothetical protein